MAITTTDRPTTEPVGADVAARAAQFLTPAVIDLEALVVNGKQAHWHARGANFIGIHELLDDVVAHAQEYADTAAERVIALGLPLIRGSRPSPRRPPCPPRPLASRAGRPRSPRSSA